jgi:3-oxoacyl-[acyl-carrier protein] reductase
VRSAFVAASRAAHHMPRGGNIVFIGSIDGEKGVPTAPPYATSKAALSGAARALAKSLGPKNIRVNVVAPGILEAGASAVVPENIRAEYLKHSNAKRYGTSEEIARTVGFFALENTYVTGKTLVCDGGV